MASPKPHIVVAMGSFQTLWHYSFLKSSIEKSGYDVTVVSLPSTGGWKVVAEAMARDIAAIRSALQVQIDAGRDVVLMAHSQGGVSASAALEGLAKLGPHPGVLHVVYLAAFLLEVGISGLEKVQGNEPPWLESKDGLQIPHRAKEILYNDVPDELADEAASLVVPNSRNVVEVPITYVPWNDVPCTYVLCEKDNAITPAVAQWLISTCNFIGEVVRMDASHSPFLSMPDKLGAIIRRAAGEEVEDMEGVKFGQRTASVQHGAGWAEE